MCTLRSDMAMKRLNSIENESRLPFTGKNYAIFAIAMLLIVLGFVFLVTGDISISPFLLVLGYCILIPVAIFAMDKPTEADNNETN